jgi:hypothetical protein
MLLPINSTGRAPVGSTAWLSCDFTYDYFCGSVDYEI